MRADLLRHADLPIANVRGWLVPRLKPVVVDDHRRRRGAIGAQQRLAAPSSRSPATSSACWADPARIDRVAAVLEILGEG